MNFSKKTKDFKDFKDDPEYVRKVIIKEYEGLKIGNKPVSGYITCLLGDALLPLYPKVFDVYIELLNDVEKQYS